MLRKIRLTFAMICFALITLLFLDFTGTLHGWFGWLAKIQFLPAVLALNVGVILFLVILTLVCGRIYCSVICPLGVFQDILAWLGRQPKKTQEASLLLFSGLILAALWRIGCVYHCLDCRNWFIGCSTCTL